MGEINKKGVEELFKGMVDLIDCPELSSTQRKGITDILKMAYDLGVSVERKRISHRLIELLEDD